MKVALVLALACLVAGANSNSAAVKGLMSNWLPQTPEEILKLADSYGVRETIRDALVAGKLSQTSLGNSRIPILPPGPDPIPISPNPLNLKFSEDYFYGFTSLSDAKVEGLSGLADDLAVKVGLIPPKVGLGYELNLPLLSFNGNYDTDVTMDLINITWYVPKINWKGNGAFHINLGNSFAKAGAAAAVPFGTVKIEFRDVLVDVGFGSLSVFFENAQVNGYPYTQEDFDMMTQYLPEVFDMYWTPLQEYLQDSITLVLNELFKDCTILQLIAMVTGGGDFSCLNLPIPPPALQ